MTAMKCCPSSDSVSGHKIANLNVASLNTVTALNSTIFHNIVRGRPRFAPMGMILILEDIATQLKLETRRERTRTKT